jgi:hypothetical protein
MMERFQRDEPGGDTAVREQSVADTRGAAERVSLGAIRARQRVFGTLLAAVVGGKGGVRYHRKVDRAGFPE